MASVSLCCAYTVWSIRGHCHCEETLTEEKYKIFMSMSLPHYIMQDLIVNEARDGWKELIYIVWEVAQPYWEYLSEKV